MSSTPLAGMGTGTIAYVLHQIGLTSCFMTGVAPVTGAQQFAGRARTLRCLPTREDIAKAHQADRAADPHRVAIDHMPAGEVLVVDARGVRDAAVCGDLLAGRVKASGGAGIVTDGCVRDLPGLLKLEFPVFAGGVHAALFGTRHLGMAVNEPVACGGVLVMPGDVLVGDCEGVVVVPAALEQKVAELCVERDELDTFIAHKIEEGLPLARAMWASSSTSKGT